MAFFGLTALGNEVHKCVFVTSDRPRTKFRNVTHLPCPSRSRLNFHFLSFCFKDVFDASSAQKLDIVAFTDEEIKETFDEFDVDDNGHMDSR